MARVLHAGTHCYAAPGRYRFSKTTSTGVRSNSNRRNGEFVAESLEHGTLLNVTIWKVEGFFNQRVGIVKKLNPIDKTITFLDELGSVFQIGFFSITDVEINS
jgi:hypothetical protein